MYSHLRLHPHRRPPLQTYLPVGGVLSCPQAADDDDWWCRGGDGHEDGDAGPKGAHREQDLEKSSGMRSSDLPLLFPSPPKGHVNFPRDFSFARSNQPWPPFPWKYAPSQPNKATPTSVITGNSDLRTIGSSFVGFRTSSSIHGLLL